MGRKKKKQLKPWCWYPFHGPMRPVRCCYSSVIMNLSSCCQFHTAVRKTDACMFHIGAFSSFNAMWCILFIMIKSVLLTQYLCLAVALDSVLGIIGAFGFVNVIIFYNRSRMLISPLSAHLLVLYTPVWSQALYIFLSIHNVFSSPSVWSLIRLSGTATEISTMKRFLFSTKKPNISNVIYVTRSCTQDLD